MPTTFRVLLNERSGSAEGKAEAIVERLRGHGFACEITKLRAGSDVAGLAKRLAAMPETVVVAAGGDGTVNAVAAATAGKGLPMGVLPAGTLNHFARDLGLPLEIDEAVDVLAKQQVSRVDAAEVNGRVFVNNSSLGFYPAMVTERERMKKVGLNKWLSLTLATLRAYVRFRRVVVRVNVGGVERKCITPFVFIGNNEYALSGTQLGTREHIDRGTLYLYLAPGLTRWGALRLTIAALEGKVKEMPNFEQICVPEFTVDVRKKTTRVSLDGEVVKLRGALRYRSLPGALAVLTDPAKEQTRQE